MWKLIEEVFAIVTGPEPEQNEESMHGREDDLSFPSFSLKGSEKMGLSQEEILTEPVAASVPHPSESQSRTV